MGKGTNLLWAARERVGNYAYSNRCHNSWNHCCDSVGRGVDKEEAITMRYRKENDNSWAWLLFGFALGATTLYFATKPKIDALEKRATNLERQVVNLSQKVVTVEGHLHSLQGFLTEQNAKLRSLEQQFHELDRKYDAVITGLEHIEKQVIDDQAKKAIRTLLEQAKRRKAERLQDLSN
jgi:hypothetical protein